MFISEKIVFIHLQKTGGVHISQILSKLLEGEKQPGHLQVHPEYHSRFIIGSMRNPWDWYVSLWAYGCAGKGGIHGKVSKPLTERQLNTMIPRYMGVDKLSPLQEGLQRSADKLKPLAKWMNTYRDHQDVEGFRRWLRLVYDEKRRYDLQEGYAFSPISQRFGLLSYRHFHLQSSLGEKLYTNTSLATLEGLREARDQYPLVDAVIRNEQLEQDLIRALDRAQVPLGPVEREMIETARKKPKNKSSRLKTADYYDEQTRQLVADREAFLIEEFAYKFPES